jgi:hypothetical protein
MEKNGLVRSEEREARESWVLSLCSFVGFFVFFALLGALFSGCLLGFHHMDPEGEEKNKWL